MAIRQALASRVTPIALRFALAGVFLWAGYGKVVTTHEFGPADLAVLANMGVAKAQAAASGAGASAAPSPGSMPEAEPPAPVEGLGAPLPDPARKGGRRVAQPAVAQAPGEGPIVSLAAWDAVAQAEPEAEATPALPARDLYDASRFEQPVRLPMYYRLAIMLKHAGASREESGSRRLWPASWSVGRYPVWFARAAAYTELIGGGLMLLGFFARFAGLALTCVMLVAIWLTSVGPNLGATGAFLGFLPPTPAPGASAEAAQQAMGAWQTLMLQITTLACALGVFLSGAGALSLDAFVFSGKPGPSKAPKADA